jgi:signal transduction histidine kinase
MALAPADMREELHRLSQAFQGAPDAILMVDAQGYVAVANRAARTLFGAPEGRTVDELLSTFGPSEEPSEVLARGAAYQLRREGLSSTRGEPAGEIVRLTDISAVRAAARQRQQVLELLTHDMRSPQASILALLDTPQEDNLPVELSARIAMYARRTLAQADNFVNLARAESVPLDPDLFDLSDLMIEAADHLWSQARAKTIKVTAEPNNDEVLLTADRSLVSRAVINLVANAVKFTDEGGKVECRAWFEDGEAVCSVSDNGRGMPPEQLARLFERFNRGGAARSSGGAGLGLAFVQTVVERHGGRIECASIPGEGTTFTLRFPTGV